jgi:hypothetical protein
MQRRRFLTRMTQALAVIGAAPVLARARSRASDASELHLQDCRIAGSAYYDCNIVLPRLHPGDPLRLRRQPDNPHDDRAIEVFWREHKLGYLPRLDNAAAASLLDRTHTMRAEILGIDDPDAAWDPVRLRVWVTPRTEAVSKTAS